MTTIRNKVFAYVTRNGRELLVFDHVHAPEAGTQVPAGTLDAPETWESGVVREVFEESGLTNVTLQTLLGEHVRDMTDFGGVDIFHRRRFFHLTCEEDTPESWEHWERHASDETGDHLFRLYWIDLFDDPPALAPDHDYFLPALLTHLQQT